MTADLIVTNARIYTLDVTNPLAEALAVRDGRILAVGSSAEVEPFVSSSSVVLDLGSKTVIPGLIDAHIHLAEFAYRMRRVKLDDVSSIDEALSRVLAAVASSRPGEWISGGGFDSNRWSRLPTRWDLDQVAPHNPVYLSSKDMHSAWVSSSALTLARIERATPDPPGGQIVRDIETGEPTGILRESAASMVARIAGLMDDSSEEKAFDASQSIETDDSALMAALDVAVGKGLTGLHVPEGPKCFAALQRLHSKGKLNIRVFHHIRLDRLNDALGVGLRTGFGDEWLRVGHVKLFLDGALGSQTDHTLEPHLESGSCGIATMPREQLTEIVTLAARGSIAPAIHAIGDAANRVALDVLESTSNIWRPAGLRPRIEHVQLLHPEDANRLGRLGIVASMQPTHQPSDWIIADRYWGPKRTPLAYAWRKILDSGATLAFGSDCPVESIDPLLGLYSAVTRQTAEGKPEGGWHPEQRLTPFEALRAYTLEPAYASGEEQAKGSLSRGKLADFVVLSEDPFAGPPGLFLDVTVLATVVGGRIVYGEL